MMTGRSWRRSSPRIQAALWLMVAMTAVISGFVR
jgi:hypothetical protein